MCHFRRVIAPVCTDKHECSRRGGADWKTESNKRFIRRTGVVRGAQHNPGVAAAGYDATDWVTGETSGGSPT